VKNITLRRWSIGFTVIGLIDSLYLTWIKLANAKAICGGLGNCDYVNSSPYAEFFGVPIALFGAGAYAMILILLVLEGRNEWVRENGNYGVFGLTLFGTLYSLYLTYIEIFVLKAICPYCLVSAIVLLILLIFAIIRMTGNE
jgi:uncharacterized membrane protein